MRNQDPDLLSVAVGFLIGIALVTVVVLINLHLRRRHRPGCG